MDSDPSLEEILAQLHYDASEVTTSWLGTSGSQVFFMQLGFLCFEVGFVKSVWAPSIILKNIEDTFVGILTYLAFSHTLVNSTPSIGGIIAVPNNPFLIGIPAELHENVFIAAVFATTCATVISGAVLERMKNKAYIMYCCLIILINYSFVAHWAWNEHGWLRKLGFLDGAGAVVIHGTGGIAALIAVWRLGPRRGALGKNGKLKEIEGAARPILIAIGAFVLWYGWFAFNISSPVSAGLGIGAAVGTTGLVTIVSPTFASCSALLLMYWDFATLSYDNLLGCMLSGLVSITGTCYTCNVWEAAIIGFFASFIYFSAQHVIRYKCGLDDPLQILSIHMCCGFYSCIMEGVFANNVMGHPGLVYGGYEHFGVQVLGVVVCSLFNLVCASFVYLVLLEKVLFKGKDIRVSILDTYLGVSLFQLNNEMAFEEVLDSKTNLAKQMSFLFHNYTVERFNNEQYDFLLAIHVYRDFVQYEKDAVKIATAIIHIIETYVLPDAIMCANVSGTQRIQLIRIRNQLRYEVQQLKSGDNNNGRKMDVSPRRSLQAVFKLDKHNKYSERTGINATNEVQERIDIPNYSKDGDRDDMHMYAARGPSGSITQRNVLLNPEVMSERMFDGVHHEVFKICLPVFAQFLQKFERKKDTVRTNVRLPFVLHHDWQLEWDEELVEQGSERLGSLSKAAAPDPDNYVYGDDEALLPVVVVAQENKSKSHGSKHSGEQRMIELINQGKKKEEFAHVRVPKSGTFQNIAFVIHDEVKKPKKEEEDMKRIEEEEELANTAGVQVMQTKNGGLTAVMHDAV